MLSRIARDIQVARDQYRIVDDFFEIESRQKESDYMVNQFYHNNTNCELTVMDSMGVRMTLPRKDNRTGDKALFITREYRIRNVLGKYARDFFDELESLDGKVLTALKEKVGENEFFRHQGFGTEYQFRNYHGHRFAVTFAILEDDIRKHDTVYSPLTCTVVSRLNREMMSINPVYGSYMGFKIDPFKSITNAQLKFYTVTANIANNTAGAREEYWINFGTESVPATVQTVPDKFPGLYIEETCKDIVTGVTQTRELKHIPFEEATKENGVFLSDRDAIVGNNIVRGLRQFESRLNEERQQLKEREHILRMRDHELKELEVQRTYELREKEHFLKEREHLMRVNETLAEEKLIHQKRLLSKEKMEYEIIEFTRSTNLEGLRYEHAVELERLKHETLSLESLNNREKGRNIERAAMSDAMNFERSIKSHQMAVQLEETKFRVNQDKHLIAARELEMQAEFNVLMYHTKLRTLELEDELAYRTHQRKTLDEGFKTFNSTLGIAGSIFKLLH